MKGCVCNHLYMYYMRNIRFSSFFNVTMKRNGKERMQISLFINM